MNIFYAPPEQIHRNIIELEGQEARHAVKALRYTEGDQITVVDGIGTWYEGIIRQTGKQTVRVEILESRKISEPHPRLKLGLGIIKKRDRLEFAVEKAVELGVSGVILFRSRHTIKQNVRIGRMESIALSAMKQSLRAWLPSVTVVRSLKELLKNETTRETELYIAHKKGMVKCPSVSCNKKKKNHVLLVGPEGGFSENELKSVEKAGGEKISLGPNRLRTETAAVVFLSKFL